MPVTHDYYLIPLSEINVPREGRQRREIADTEDLENSIRQHGVLQPIIIQEDAVGAYTLIIGERRLTACKRLGHVSIPARIARDLTPVERQIIELEENLKRQDLPWKDEVRAVKRIHNLYCNLNPAQTVKETAERVSIAYTSVHSMLQVADALDAGNKLVEQATGWRPAYNIIARHESRRMDDVISSLLETPRAVVRPAPQAGEPFEPQAKPDPEPLQEESIIKADFLEWAPAYAGQPFNFIHCDFPYGIGIDESEQSNIGSYGKYADTVDTYWTLCKALADNRDRIISGSAHIMFWLPNEIDRQWLTLEFFRETMPEVVFQTVPLIWHKTDNRGILSDFNRRPRNVVETALIGSRGDRLLVKAVSNAYGSPTTKEVHQSEKAEPMLRHFFQMFVGDTTRMLDPTCGSGSALRAAESLGAKEVLGLELDDTFIAGARSLLRKARNLRSFVA